MIGKMKAKMILVSIMIAMIAGMVSGGTLWLCENCKCLCKKAKKNDGMKKAGSRRGAVLRPRFSNAKN